MRKIVYLAMVIAVFNLSGCTDKNTADGPAGNNPAKGNFDMRRPDFGQPKRTPDIRGLVSSMVGNEAKILKIERPQSGEEAKEEENGGAAGANETRTAALGAGANSTGRMPGIGGQGFRPGNGSTDQAAQDAMLERMKAMSTGEETVLIPVGIQMLKSGDDPEKIEMVEATLEDINENKMIQVWLNEGIRDQNVAEFVLIMR